MTTRNFRKHGSAAAQAGFTLVEMAVVLVIIVALPSVKKSREEAFVEE